MNDEIIKVPSTSFLPIQKKVCMFGNSYDILDEEELEQGESILIRFPNGEKILCNIEIEELRNRIELEDYFLNNNYHRAYILLDYKGVKLRLYLEGQVEGLRIAGKLPLGELNGFA